jgi:cobalt-zinc-cadmium resistance protein CzcA
LLHGIFLNMFDRIIYFSIRNKLIIALLTLALIAWGAYSALQLPIDAVPDITNNQVQIITRSPALAAPEIERLITFPVETALATIPGREEIRSFSRFGLSVVTIVFREDIDVYWARQQVAERIKEAESQIPAGVGAPEIAPVTTGLGEIYQYVLQPRKGYEDRYSLTELRSLQDWIVRRRLLGTEGVADVSSYGGRLKQYEIALNPDRLRALGVSMTEIFQALERNNHNTGGAYIDKEPKAYFIRTEGLARSLDDLGAIAVKTLPNGVPVLIRDVATLRIGFATRYGAMTRTAPGEPNGEVVGGLALMLKGENSSKAIARVKERIEEIAQSLPEGVEIVPFLDRTKLVNGAIATVATNLAEGALIVMFILTLFLGNLRAGLVVASAIPLSLLFALGMMNVFGVSANLMSLGAIDFGIIVDGAVIIVEATLHHLHSPALAARFSGGMSRAEMDAEVYQSASKIRLSASFGEIIILIVYLPILSLVGIEGKMFRPMAQTVSFAILGAFILSLTYIPMMSAWLLSRTPSTKKTYADLAMERAYRWYAPILDWSLRRKGAVVASALALFAAALFAFSQMGAEFIPTLDEGDFAVETRAMTGSSLNYTVETTLRAGRILVDNFPEVTQVVGKIGSSEIPTDPMPIEAADLMVILKPRTEWTSAQTREELAEKMHERLKALTGVEFGFQQPIQMRFNELITGAKQDVAIKIFGEDLDALAALAAKIGKIAAGIRGVADVYVERVTGLAQIVARVRREDLARYGASVEDVNRAVQTAFAGASAGRIFENERRYDVVVRLDSARRTTLEDVRNLLIATPAGAQIPLERLATVEIEYGANQIQREDAKRRITVGFNVRNRDVESVVEELRAALRERAPLPPGYYFVVGGAFENLVEAKQRLAVAVPAALALIFILLYFSFRSVKYSALIFTAVPLSAIGGVAALYARGMPFSISAGVGFIALFGVSVLNGIVLIAYFNRLKEEGMTNPRDIIFQGTLVRLRPVLMTAAVASFGFLPMAISTSPGAEVQKPLATVVIGGLFSATALTLIVLPVLYAWVETWTTNKNDRINGASASGGVNGNAAAVVAGVIIACASASAQSPTALPQEWTLERALAEALRRNPALKAAESEESMRRALQRTAGDIGKTTFSFMGGQYNSAANDNNFTVSQTFPFPTAFGAQAAAGAARARSAELGRYRARNELVFAVKSAFYEIVSLRERERLLSELLLVMRAFDAAARKRYESGESPELEASFAALQAMEAELAAEQIRFDVNAAARKLQELLALDEPISIAQPAALAYPLPKRLSDDEACARNPLYALARQQISVAESEREAETARVLPDWSVGCFSQTLIGVQENGQVFGANDRFLGVQISLHLPLWIAPHLAKIEAASFAADVARAQADVARLQCASAYSRAWQEAAKFKSALDFYEQSALPQAKRAQAVAQKSYEQGEIGYVEYSQALARALSTMINYQESLWQYNKAALLVEFLSGGSPTEE